MISGWLRRFGTIALVILLVMTSLTSASTTLNKIEKLTEEYIEDYVIEEEDDNYQDLLNKLRDSLKKYEYVPSEIIVKFKEESDYSSKKIIDGVAITGKKSVDILNKEYGVKSIEAVFNTTVHPSLSNIYVFEIQDALNIVHIAKKYNQIPEIEFAEPNYIYETCKIPNDPFFDKQWGLNQSSDFDIDAPEAWDIQNDSSNVTIAILDTGVDYNHLDLADNIWINEDEIPDNKKDDDKNGYIDDIRGYDFVHTTNPVAIGEDGLFRDNDPMDNAGHGTHCAGIAAADTNNGIGVAGVCWNAKIMPVRVGYKSSDDIGYIDSKAAALGLLYAANNGADVISMSYGGPIRSLLAILALNYAYDKGVVLVAAAGNQFSNKKHYPAAYKNVIAVAATDRNDYKAYFSNYGGWVDVAAPGVDIMSTILDNQYVNISGTSMACPMVAGLAGLILSKNDSLSPDQVKTILKYSVDRLYPLEFPIPRGRVNARKALMVGTGSATALITSPIHGEEVKDVVNIVGIAKGDGFHNYSVEIAKGAEIGTPIWNVINYSEQPIEDGILYSLDTTELNEGLYTIRLRAACKNEIYEDKSWIIVNNEINTFIVDNETGPEVDQTSIRWGIYDAANEDSVLVYNGTYEGNIRIYKSINLIGQNRNNTIISGYGDGDVVYVNANRVNISGFTIKNGWLDRGVYFYKVKKCVLYNNNITNNWIGVKLSYSKANTIQNNNIYNNTHFGILLTRRSNRNKIKHNNFMIPFPIWYIHAYFRNSYLNRWSGNYWDDWIGLKIDLLKFKPKRIPGRLLDIILDPKPHIIEDIFHQRLTIRANYDFRPAQEPFVI